MSSNNCKAFKQQVVTSIWSMWKQLNNYLWLRCDERVEGGYYSDPEFECQAFHICVRVSSEQVFLKAMLMSSTRLVRRSWPSTASSALMDLCLTNNILSATSGSTLTAARRRRNITLTRQGEYFETIWMLANGSLELWAVNGWKRL